MSISPSLDGRNKKQQDGDAAGRRAVNVRGGERLKTSGSVNESGDIQSIGAELRTVVGSQQAGIMSAAFCDVSHCLHPPLCFKLAAYNNPVCTQRLIHL